MTGRHGTAPAVPPAKRGHGLQDTALVTAPRRSELRQNARAIQRLADEVKRAAASDKVHVNNAAAVAKAVQTADFGGLAWKHVMAVNDHGVVAMGELIDFGKQLHAADKLAYDL